MARRAKPEPEQVVHTPPESVNYRLVKKGPVEPRKFRVGEISLARLSFSIIPRRSRQGRRSGAWRTFVPAGRIQTSAVARAPRRRTDELEGRLGIHPSDTVHGIPSAPKYRPPGGVE